MLFLFTYLIHPHVRNVWPHLIPCTRKNKKHTHKYAQKTAIEEGNHRVNPLFFPLHLHQPLPIYLRRFHKPIRARIHHIIRDIELILRHRRARAVGAHLQPGIRTARRRCEASDRTVPAFGDDGQAGHVEEVKDVEVLELVGGGGDGLGAAGAGLAGDEEVEVEGAAAHVGQDLDRGRGDALAVGGGGRAPRVLVLGQHALQQRRVARAHVPVGAHVAQRRHEQVDGRVDAVVDGRAVDEQDPRRYPEREGEGWAERGQERGFARAGAEGYDGFDGVEAALAGAEAWGEDGRAVRGVGC